MVLVSIRIMGVITCYNPTLVTEGNVILDQNGVSKLSKKCVPKNQKRVVRFKPSLNKPVQFVAVTICYPFYVGICLMGLSDVRSRPDVFPDHLWTKQQNHLNCRSIYHTKRVDQQRSDLLINRWGMWLGIGSSQLGEITNVEATNETPRRDGDSAVASKNWTWQVLWHGSNMNNNGNNLWVYSRPSDG